MLDPLLLAVVACPHDFSSLRESEGKLRCPRGHAFPIVDGIPVLLREDVYPNHLQGKRALDVAAGREPPAPGEDRKPGELTPGEIDPVVQDEIVRTNGNMYRTLRGNLRSYPIPEIALPAAHGETFLEIGSNWGRWCIAAARRGYTVIGVDPSLRGVRAGQRVARQLGVDVRFVVGDGRHLPFQADGFDVVFSYSVIQHLSKEDAAATLGHAGRVLRPGGLAMIQMPNAYGLRALYQRARRRFREARGFEVRYWTPRELRRRFSALIGPSVLAIDGFFSLNPQLGERHLLPLRFRVVVSLSEALRRIGAYVPALLNLADSIMVLSRKRDAAEAEHGGPAPHVRSPA